MWLGHFLLWNQGRNLVRMNFFSNDILYFLKVLDKQNSSPKRRLLRNKKRCDFFRKNWNITVFFHIQILTFSDIMAFCYIGFFLHWAFCIIGTPTYWKNYQMAKCVYHWNQSLPIILFFKMIFLSILPLASLPWTTPKYLRTPFFLSWSWAHRTELNRFD